MPNTPLPPSPSDNPNPNLPRDLLLLYDDFVDFHNTCAFFCEAVTAMLTTNPDLDRATIEGIASFSSHIKETTTALKERLNLIRQMP